MTKKISTVLALALLLASMAAAPVTAIEEESDELSIWFDEEAGELIFGVGLDCAPADDTVVTDDAEGESAADASSTEAEELETEMTEDDDDTEVTDDAEGESADDASSAEAEELETEMTEDDAEEAAMLDLSVCNSISVVGPSGKVNHGSVVSGFVHALKNADVDGPRGQLVSQVAKSDFGKKTDEKAEKTAKPGKAEKAKKEKADKATKKGNNGKALGKNK